ncbi:DMT family transporter [Aliiroseovarius sp. KMU-50]|uniref:DMT family transporter n=1 Tax=Aliiroseovarius salicola TaxID=3009082 RepID=A0ABT4VYV9_9RHOB|nr:DMT family transporter [Aliiroseovarius sp. KMU-50]MDA5093396.1 DMT family transporter [Aliiroseovarius sp. KMU-50]
MQLRLIGFLALLGAGWALTGVLSKPVVEAGHGIFGIILWQMAIGATILTGVSRIRGKSVPLTRNHLPLYLFVALGGTIFPNAASYLSLDHLPAGVMAIIIAAVPMFAFPMALLLKSENFATKRLFGLLAGLIGVAILVGPQSALPEGAWFWIAIALIAPALYGIEGNVVAKWGTGGLDPVQVLAGASLVGLPIAGVMAVLTGGWIDPFSDFDGTKGLIVLNSVIHAFVYSGYVWLVRRAGASFAAQVSYLVTGFGVIWAMLLLGERYSGSVWLALAVMFLGLFLVQPRTTGAAEQEA